jgi:glucan biosynthesis protein C
MEPKPSASDQKGAGSSPSAGKPRLWYLDYLKVFLTVLVVLHHTATTYGAPGSWYYSEFEFNQLDFPTGFILVLFVAVNQAYFMGLFFLISAFFTPDSVDRKGATVFLKDRLVRLGIPILAYMYLLDPVLQYGIAAARHGSPFSAEELASSFVRSFGSWHVGPLWFTELLVVFSLMYIVGRWIAAPRGATPFPGHKAIAGLAALIGVVDFIVRLWFPIGSGVQPLGIQLSFLFQYICLFAVGIAAYRGDWLSGLTVAAGKAWLRVALILTGLLSIVPMISGGLEGFSSRAMGGPYWQALLYAVWEQLVGMGLIVSLLVFFRERANRPGAFRKILSANAYTVYIIHPLVVVFLAMSIRNVSLPPLAKFVLVGPAAVGLCFLAAAAVRRLPFAKAIL